MFFKQFLLIITFVRKLNLCEEPGAFSQFKQMYKQFNKSKCIFVQIKFSYSIKSVLGRMIK